MKPKNILHADLNGLIHFKGLYLFTVKANGMIPFTFSMGTGGVRGCVGHYLWLSVTSHGSVLWNCTQQSLGNILVPEIESRPFHASPFSVDLQ